MYVWFLVPNELNGSFHKSNKEKVNAFVVVWGRSWHTFLDKEGEREPEDSFSSSSFRTLASYILGRALHSLLAFDELRSHFVGLGRSRRTGF